MGHESTFGSKMALRRVILRGSRFSRWGRGNRICCEKSSQFHRSEEFEKFNFCHERDCVLRWNKREAFERTAVSSALRALLDRFITFDTSVSATVSLRNRCFLPPLRVGLLLYFWPEVRVSPPGVKNFVRYLLT